jgi:hypothetical protein
MLIRTNLPSDASWSEALLGSPHRAPVDAPASTAPAVPEPSGNIVQAAPASGEEGSRKREARDAVRAARDAQQAASEQQDLQLIRKLRSRDREVRAHEQAHSSVGGQYAGAASFTYQRGPDGVLYAVGGEVSIDVGAIPGNPQATLDKALQVQRAALAPRDPSSTDRQVAQRAAGLARDARAQLAELVALERETAPRAEEVVESATKRIDTTA